MAVELIEGLLHSRLTVRDHELTEAARLDGKP
jgi:hypothetical protein